MKINAPQPVIPKSIGFTKTNDIFNLEPFAERIERVFRNAGSPLVCVLDGGWGTGKTVFSKQLFEWLSGRGAPVIFFDAFANDVLDDAFIALAGAIHEFARKRPEVREQALHRYVQAAKRLGGSLMPVSAKVVVRAATVGLLSSDDLKDASDALRESIDTAGSEMSKAVDGFISERIKSASADVKAIEVFRNVLEETAKPLLRAESSPEEDNPFPLIFIIDELDRCRPQFAEEIFHALKHFFNAEGVVFLVVTNLQSRRNNSSSESSLVNSGETPYDKFYDLAFHLPDAEEKRNRDVYVGQIPAISSSYAKELIDFQWKHREIPDDEPYFREVKDCVTVFCQLHNISLRRISRIVSGLCLFFIEQKFHIDDFQRRRKKVPKIRYPRAGVFNRSDRSNLYFQWSSSSGPGLDPFPALVAGLATMREVDARLFKLACGGRIEYRLYREFFSGLRQDEDKMDYELFIFPEWRYFLSGILSEDELREYGDVHNLSFANRVSCLATLAASMEVTRVG